MAQEDQKELDELDVPKHVGVGIAFTTDPQMARGLLEQFCLALADATGLTVSPRGVSSYTRLMEQVAAGEVDLVWLPPIPALRATADDHVRPIALPIRNGESSYRAALFTRPDSAFQSLDKLHNARAAWVDPQSAAGYLILRAHLEQRGMDLARAFSEDIFCGSHDAVARAVLDGKADVGATFAYLDDQGRPKRAGWGSAQVTIIDSVGPVPNDIIAARSGLSSLLVRLVQSALVDVQNVQLREAARLLLTAEGFEVPSDEHLAPLVNLVHGLKEASNQPHSLFPPPKERA